MYYVAIIGVFLESMLTRQAPNRRQQDPAKTSERFSPLWCYHPSFLPNQWFYTFGSFQLLQVLSITNSFRGSLFCFFKDCTLYFVPLGKFLWCAKICKHLHVANFFNKKSQTWNLVWTKKIELSWNLLFEDENFGDNIHCKGGTIFLDSFLSCPCRAYPPCRTSCHFCRISTAIWGFAVGSWS